MNIKVIWSVSYYYIVDVDQQATQCSEVSVGDLHDVGRTKGKGFSEIVIFW